MTFYFMTYKILCRDGNAFNISIDNQAIFSETTSIDKMLHNIKTHSKASHLRKRFSRYKPTILYLGRISEWRKFRFLISKYGLLNRDGLKPKEILNDLSTIKKFQHLFSYCLKSFIMDGYSVPLENGYSLATSENGASSQDFKPFKCS